MTKRRNQGAAVKRAQPPAKKRISTTTWIVGAIVLIGVAVAVSLAIGNTKGAASSTAAAATGSTTNASSAGSVSADEQKYVGRFLPASYTEPAVAGASTYSTELQMSNVTPTQGKTQISVPVAEAVAKKIVYFEYQKPGAAAVPLMAYVKPSGKLFVGVSFCPPCQGKAQTIEPDGTLRCSACGTKRDLETGAGVSGACRRYPIDELPATVSGGKIVVQDTALDKWTPQPIDRPVGA
jgi:nitrite reductase/ring-hydroxylating ferredoxin subunit